ncbi:MAG TPA: glycoside hydrolase family 3 protein [Terriglobales bacterium]|nr:glycoside hydrolase family 3 protein [Terriglobales bacterium]
MPKRLAIILLLFIGSCVGDDKFQRPAPVRLTHDGDKWAQKTLRKLSLEEKIGQMLMIRAQTEFFNAQSPDFLQLRDNLRRYHVGGVLLTVASEGGAVFRNQPYEAAMLTNQLQRDSRLPLIFAADFERGLAMRFHGTTGFPAAMAFAATGNPRYAAEMARVVAQEARAIGVEWNFFPVADVNSAPANPIINTRAFGEDPQQVIPYVLAYLGGARENGMLTTAKHFPGHGDVETDSHLGIARVFADRAHLDTLELPAFRAAIGGGVDSVMVAHVTVPALDPDPNRVASVSRAVIDGVLKQQLGFQGLVITDAMDMNAITRLFPGGRAAVEAVKAGNDVVLIPADLNAAFNGLINAVRSGEIPEAQIDASVLKILRAKAAVGLHKARLIDIQALAENIARPADMALAEQVADEAVALVRDNGHVIPVQGSGTPAPLPAYQTPGPPGTRVLVVVFSDDVRTDAGRVLEREVRARIPGVNMFYIDPRIASGMSQQVLEAAEHAQTVVAAAIAAPSAGKMLRVNGVLAGSVSLDDATAALLHSLLERAAGKTALLALGNPYLAAQFPEVQNYLCTFSNAPVSEISAVKALFGEISIRGRLPVTIPGIAARGAGIDRAALAQGGHP